MSHNVNHCRKIIQIAATFSEKNWCPSIFLLCTNKAKIIKPDLLAFSPAKIKNYSTRVQNNSVAKFGKSKMRQKIRQD
jgi:hypothetical protein